MKLRQRPALGVSLRAIERELLDKCGSVAAAARALGVSSLDLRRLVGSRPSLADAVYEETERAIDDAVQVILDGLSHPDKTRRLAAAAYLLVPYRGWAAPRLGKASDAASQNRRASGRHDQMDRLASKPKASRRIVESEHDR